MILVMHDSCILVKKNELGGCARIAYITLQGVPKKLPFRNLS